MQLNIFSLMYIIRVYVRRVKHTSTRTIYVRNRFCTHCRMTNENLWIERVFQGRFIDKSFTGNRAKNKGKTQTAKIKYKFDRRVFVASMRMKHIGTKAYDLRTARQQGCFFFPLKSLQKFRAQETQE